jgi:hypothetical protein
MISGERVLGSNRRWGGVAVTFDEVLEQALEMLRRCGRVSYCALKVQFQLDDDLLELLKDEIVEVHQLARHQEGKMLVWTGDTAALAPNLLPPDQEHVLLTYTPPHLAEELSIRPLAAHCHDGLGQLYSQTGRAEQAHTELSTAITMYRSMDMTFWLPQAEAALAQMEGR